MGDADVHNLTATEINAHAHMTRDDLLAAYLLAGRELARANQSIARLGLELAESDRIARQFMTETLTSRVGIPVHLSDLDTPERRFGR